MKQRLQDCGEVCLSLIHAAKRIRGDTSASSSYVNKVGTTGDTVHDLCEET